MLSLAESDGRIQYFVVEDGLDNPTNQWTKLNYENLCDLQVLLGFACILPLLEYVHALIKFAQMKDVYVCDLVATIKVFQGDIYTMYCDQTSKFTKYNFWTLKTLLELKHENI
jgi:hypothetical protein